jgi:hypothetical protein
MELNMTANNHNHPVPNNEPTKYPPKLPEDQKGKPHPNQDNPLDPEQGI